MNGERLLPTHPTTLHEFDRVSFGSEAFHSHGDSVSNPFSFRLVHLQELLRAAADHAAPQQHSQTAAGAAAAIPDVLRHAEAEVPVHQRWHAEMQAALQDACQSVGTPPNGLSTDASDSFHTALDRTPDAWGAAESMEAAWSTEALPPSSVLRGAQRSTTHAHPAGLPRRGSMSDLLEPGAGAMIGMAAGLLSSLSLPRSHALSLEGSELLSEFPSAEKSRSPPLQQDTAAEPACNPGAPAMKPLVGQHAPCMVDSKLFSHPGNQPQQTAGAACRRSRGAAPQQEACAGSAHWPEDTSGTHSDAASRRRPSGLPREALPHGWIPCPTISDAGLSSGLCSESSADHVRSEVSNRSLSFFYGPSLTVLFIGRSICNAELQC